jgi:precorrin-4/cobalt-precorrin-4 C11-methyltransferase
MPQTLLPVVFAGAGPGDPDLITVKAMKALSRADVIIYAGSLVPESVLTWKGPHARTLSSADLNLEQIVDIMDSHYRDGKAVVRLHTGDPSLYGAIFEQMRELDRRGIPYQVIPGVTAAFAAAAAMTMEYTLPETTQTLILTRISGRTPAPDSENLESLAAHQASMAIYLSMGHVSKVAQILADHYGKEAWCAVAFKVSHPEEKIVYCRIRDLDATCREHRIVRHALIIAGKAVTACMENQDLLKSKLYDAGFSHGYRSANQ